MLRSFVALRIGGRATSRFSSEVALDRPRGKGRAGWGWPTRRRTGRSVPPGLWFRHRASLHSTVCSPRARAVDSGSPRRRVTTSTARLRGGAWRAGCGGGRGPRPGGSGRGGGGGGGRRVVADGRGSPWVAIGKG